MYFPINPDNWQSTVSESCRNIYCALSQASINRHGLGKFTTVHSCKGPNIWRHKVGFLITTRLPTKYWRQIDYGKTITVSECKETLKPIKSRSEIYGWVSLGSGPGPLQSSLHMATNLPVTDISWLAKRLWLRNIASVPVRLFVSECLPTVCLRYWFRLMSLVFLETTSSWIGWRYHKLRHKLSKRLLENYHQLRVQVWQRCRNVCKKIDFQDGRSQYSLVTRVQPVP
jgi:hypothetical protein